MKNIKLFENFDLEKIKSGIDDVFVELKDNGFGVRKVASNDGLIVHITGIIDPNYDRSTFEFSEIEEYVLMLIDYVNTYLPKYKDDVRFLGFDSDFDKIIDILKDPFATYYSSGSIPSLEAYLDILYETGPLHTRDKILLLYSIGCRCMRFQPSAAPMLWNACLKVNINIALMYLFTMK